MGKSGAFRLLLDRRILGRFFVNALLLVLLPTLVLMLSNEYVLSNMVLDAVASERRVLTMTIDQLDNDVSDVQIYASTIAHDANAMTFAYCEAPLTNDSRLLAYKLMRKLKTYAEYDTLAYTTAIYFPESDRIVTHSAMYTPAEYYSQFLSDGITFTKWQTEWLNESSASNYVLIDSSLGTGIAMPQLHFIAAYPFSGSNECACVVDIVLDRENILNTLQAIRHEGAIYVRNRTGAIIANVGDIAAYPAPTMPYDDTDYDITIDGQSVKVINQRSEVTGWSYTLLVPNNVLINSANGMILLHQKLQLISVLLALICALLITWLNYRPIDKLKRMAIEYSIDAAPAGSDELDIIHHNMENAYRRNQELTQAQMKVLEQYNQMLASRNKDRHILLDGLILRLTRGDSTDMQALESWLATAEVSFKSVGYSIALAHISEFGSDDVCIRQDDRNDILATVARFFQEMCATIGQAYAIQQPNDTALILINTDESFDTVAKLLRNTQNILLEKNDFKVSIGLGRIKTSLTEICYSFEEANAALEYRFVKGKGLLITADEVSLNDKKTVRLTDDFINQIETSIIKRDAEQLEKLIVRLNDEYCPENMSMFQAQSLYYNIMNVMLNTLDKSRIDINQLFGQAFDPLEEMMSCETINEVIETLEDILRSICSQPAETQTGRSAQIAKQALSLIYENFNRNDFSQQWVADKLNISTAYLSRCVKQETGRNMVDILNILRVEKAREYLQTTEWSTAEIAQQIGFGSAKSLTRILRQYVGMTPSELRSKSCGAIEYETETEEEKLNG